MVFQPIKMTRFSIMNEIGIKKSVNGIRSTHFGSHQNRNNSISDRPESALQPIEDKNKKNRQKRIVKKYYPCYFMQLSKHQE